jgi:hypothetical protein
MNYFDYLRTTLGNATNEAQTRWNAAKPKILAGTYKADDWFKDTLYVWLVTMQPFWNVWAVGTEANVPIVAFEMVLGSSPNPKPVTVYILPSVPPGAVHVTDLQQLGGTKTLTGDTDVTAALSDSALTVTLVKNLSGMPKGNYAGAVYFGPTVDRTIALVNITIS